MTLLFRPMLAYNKTPDLNEIKYPVFASPKLDGIRCVMADGIACSRTMKRIPNKHIQDTLMKLRLHGLDGELMVEGDFNTVQSAVMSVGGKPDFTYHVFDHFEHENSTFVDRYNTAVEVARKLDSPYVKIVHHVLINNAEELQAYWDECVELGYEGAMVRSLAGPYKRGRSTLLQGYLLKLKSWIDDEAIITGTTELMHNDNDAELGEVGQTKRSKHQSGLTPADTLGALCVVWAGKEFKIGSGKGLTEDLRRELWQKREALIGQKVTFKYLNLSAYGTPRHPMFKGIRYE